MNPTKTIIHSPEAYAELITKAIEGGIAEHFAIIHAETAFARFDEQLNAVIGAFEQLKARLEGSACVFSRFFLSDVANQTSHVRQASGEMGCAVSIIGQPPLDGTKVALLAYFVDGASLSRLGNGTVVASHGGYRHYWSCTNANPFASSYSETHALLNNFSDTLKANGMTMADNCLRTWFFVDNIDINYHGMVKARNEMFRLNGLTEATHYIASTGIAGRNANPEASVTADFYGIEGVAQQQIRHLYASDNLSRTSLYGVSFERGTAVDYGDRRHVFISGTASIDHRGEVLHVGDIVGQTHRMIENVEALLAEAECSFADVGYVIVYLRDIADYQVVMRLCGERFGALPLVVVNAPVCRPQWLVEMECVAVKPIAAPQFPRF